jgi:DNA invertase Pin-like site-specific DNA recombinase
MSIDQPGEQKSIVRNVVGLLSGSDRELIRQRTRAALAAKRSRGERIGVIPYGMALAPDGIRLIRNDAEQAVIALVRELAAKGMSQRAIVAELDARGVRGRTGAPMQKTQIARILSAA